MSISETIAECLADLGVEIAKEHIQNDLDEKQLKKDLADYINRREKEQDSALPEEEVDWAGLIAFLKEHFTEKAGDYCFQFDSQKRGEARKTIIEGAAAFAHAENPSSKKLVSKWVGDCLNIYKAFFDKKIDKKYRLLAAYKCCYEVTFVKGKNCAEQQTFFYPRQSHCLAFQHL